MTASNFYALSASNLCAADVTYGHEYGEGKLLLHQRLPPLCSCLFYGLYRIPNNRPNSVARFRLQVFTPLKKSMRWANGAVVVRETAIEQTFSITVLIILLISIMTCCEKPGKCGFCLVSGGCVKLISRLV